jgi:NADPH-dependent curcumin reductase CurA
VFKLVERAVPEPAEGEVLVRCRLVSVGPGDSAYLSGPTYQLQVMCGELMCKFAIAEVVGSRHSGFEPGDIVEGWVGWQEYAAIAGEALLKRNGGENLADLVSVLGMTGLTAY